jgi:vacuolar protein-sorting-associated protein 4
MLTKEDFEELGAKTEGFSGSDIAVVVKDVLMQPIRKTQDATHFKKVKMPDGSVKLIPCSPGDARAFEASLASLADSGKAAMVHPPDICMNDFRKVLLRSRPTVSSKDLEDYRNFTEEFGEEG